MSIFSSPARKAVPAIPEGENGFLRIPIALKIALGIAVFLELLAPFVSTSYGLDGRFHLNWIAQFTKLIDDGILFPRWVPDGFYGFGAASFYFYPPLTFYFAALLHGLSGVTAPTALFQAINFLASIASFFSARALLRSLGSPRTPSTIGALLYTFAPLRIAELYHRAALPTHLAYVFLPLVWLGLVTIVRQDGERYKRIVFFAIALALMALTSVPFLLVTLCGVIVAGLVQWKRIVRTALAEIAFAGILTACLVAFHYLAALSATPFTDVNEIKMGHAPFAWRDYMSMVGLYYMAMTYIPMMGIGFAYWKLRRLHSGESIVSVERTSIRIGLAMASVVLFLEIPQLSRILWNNVLPLQLIGFNIRFYSQALLALCVIVGVARSIVMQRAVMFSLWFLILGAVGPIILVVLNMHLYPHFNVPLEDAQEYRPVYTVSRPLFVHSIAPHASDSAAIGNFLPDEGVKFLHRTPKTEALLATIIAPRQVTFHRFYWPFWHLYANGSEISSRPDSIGRATAVLPVGSYTAVWRLERTPLECWGIWISGIAWIGVLLFWGIGLVRWRVRKKIPFSP